MVGGGAALRGPSRRRVLGTAAAALLAAHLPVRAGAPVRLAAIDWAMLETATAIGHMPVAAAELIRFRADVPQPDIPPGVVDLGLRGAPNFELLQLTRPTLILSSPYYTRYEDRLRRIAPVLSLPFYLPGQPPLPKALDALDALARAIGDAPAGARARADADAALDRAAARVARHAARAIALIDIGDARHLRAFGFDSLPGSTLDRIGLTNAWTEQTAFSFLAPVPIQTLATMPDATLVLTAPVPPEVRRALSRSVLWRALPQVAAGRVLHLPPVNPFGGAPSAVRFAQGLADALDAVA